MVRVGGIAVDQLKAIIGRIERLEEEKSGLGADISDVYKEAKGNGFDVKAIRQIIKLRKMDAQEREEAESILDTYMRALGMQPDFFDEEETQQEKKNEKPYTEAEGDEGIQISALEKEAAAYT